MTTGRIRRRAAGVALAVILVGVVASWATPTISAASAPTGAILSAQEQTDTNTTGGASSGGAGSWWAFGLVLLGLAAGIGGIFFWDLYRTNVRQDRALEFLKKHPQALSESDRARVLDKLTTGTEGLTRGLLGFSLIGLFAVALLYLLIRNPAIRNIDVVQNAMAALITLVTAVVSFYYGTRSVQSSVTSLPPLPPGEPVDDDDVPPDGDDVPPDGDDVPPDGDDMPPDGDDMPPVGDDVPPVQGERDELPPPVGGDVPPVPPVQGERDEPPPPVDGDVPPVQGERDDPPPARPRRRRS